MSTFTVHRYGVLYRPLFIVTVFFTVTVFFIVTQMLHYLHCPTCQGELITDIAAQSLACTSCGISFRMQAGIPIFTEPPPDLIPSERLERGPDIGTPWRKANWRFLQQQINLLPQDALILDVGAGRGDFASALQGRQFVELEIYPYPEVNVVCDLTRTNPFRPASFDAVVLLNVLEHVYETDKLLKTLSLVLKPGGVLLVAIPFMVKIHQAPVDFLRYTHFALERLGQAHGFSIESLEGYYDPVFFLGEGIGNLQNAFLRSPGLSNYRRLIARLTISGIRGLATILGKLIGPGKMMLPSSTRSLAPTGYHVVFRKLNNDK